MGMNMILTIIAGIVMTTMVGTQVAPSIIDQIKVKKIEVQTINNQEVIFEATKRYITMKQDVPATDFIGELIKANYIDEKVNDNGFSGTYEVNVDKALGVATITTTITDPKAQEAFLNSFTSMSKPTCTGTIVDGVCDTNEFKTKFVLPNEVMHGNALLMTGIPIQATEPDPSETKYWYDTSSGKAVLKLFNGTSWVEVSLGVSTDEIIPRAPAIQIKSSASNLYGSYQNTTGTPIILWVQGKMSGKMSGNQIQGCFAIYIGPEKNQKTKSTHYEGYTFNVLETIPNGYWYSFNTGCYTESISVSQWWHIPQKK